MVKCRNCGNLMEYKSIRVDNRGTLLFYVCKKCGFKKKAGGRGKITKDDWQRYGFYYQKECNIN